MYPSTWRVTQRCTAVPCKWVVNWPPLLMTQHNTPGTPSGVLLASKLKATGSKLHQLTLTSTLLHIVVEYFTRAHARRGIRPAVG